MFRFSASRLLLLTLYLSLFTSYFSLHISLFLLLTSYLYLPTSYSFISDICLTKPVGYTYSIDHLCSGYITCIGGRSHGACCDVNERWAAGTGCVFDPTCRDACDREDDNRIVFPHGK